ncbi:hypothetical protein H6G00_27305 [Leptolyngbya sp. FACHB-541]|uniref:hypothetical protein n=1 Tax=Leptolyngbya sp. FACHB-541 TaxID=2692810 RepID=UPI0016867B02|nr:hypothetical protein [Leptolyngbya sp. FACHB-541]MBD2000269.1 hypothetical protein [Leptolyngbya sp. FACHB-541]
MEEAKAADQLALLCNNVLMMAIIHAHLAWHLGQTAIFAADVALAWRLAEDLFEDHPSQAIALQCRYALIVSTLNSLSTDLPPPSPGALLQKYVRVPKQGLAYALQSSNPETKAILLTEISDYLPQNLKEEALQEALAATKAIQYENDRLKALKILAPKLPPDLLQEALAIAMDIRFERDRGERSFSFDCPSVRDVKDANG